MTLRWCVLSLALFLAGGAAAQDKKVVEPADNSELNTQAYIQLLRQNIQAKREAILREGMQLDERQGAAFWPIYKDYAAEQQKLGDQKLAIIQEYAKDFLTMNDTAAQKIADQVMALDDQRLALRRKYFDLMKKALPTVLVLRFFQLDQQIQLLLDLQIAANLPIIEEAPPAQP
ncbi:MAG TPA: hypothetical protein VMT75_01635 [Candidatus Saccharimonadales bacterium]|nr:hypothetical protein [Candidatus Saccharimonadales bacterium]